MATESIKSANKTIRRYFNEESLALTCIAAGDLYEGQEVKITADQTVNKRTVGTEFPIGYVKVGATSGNEVTVVVNASSDLTAKAIGGTLSAGAFVKPNGNISTDGVPEYVATASGDYANAIVLTGGAANAEIRLLLLNTPVKV